MGVSSLSERGIGVRFESRKWNDFTLSSEFYLKTFPTFSKTRVLTIRKLDNLLQRNFVCNFQWGYRQGTKYKCVLLLEAYTEYNFELT